MAHILVVDDSPTDQYAIQSILEQAGHHVSKASTIDESIELARALQPDVITMDIVFEGQRGASGFMGVRKIKRDPESQHIPIIIMSSKGQPSDKAWGLRQGASNYLVKPITTEALLAAVNELLPPEGDAA